MDDTRCPITGFPIHSGTLIEEQQFYKYHLDIESFYFTFQIDPDQWEVLEAEVQGPTQVLLTGALLNNQLDLYKRIVFWHTDDLPNDGINLQDWLDDFSAGGNYPKNQRQKYENLFLALLRFQDFDGQSIKLEAFLREFPVRKLYLTNPRELGFYLESLKKNGLLSFDREGTQYPNALQVTYEGLNYGVKLQEEGQHSNKVFIAMSYGPGMAATREAIKTACIATGFDPILVDETHYSSDRTINDAMIAQIKQSRFCIADFSEQKDGVYFEAGFALGKGLKVIYTCHKDWWGKSHFDTRHFPHIVYEDLETLRQGLINKINAWVV